MDSLMAVELSLVLERKFALPDYSLALSEKTTARSLALSLTDVLRSGGERRTGDEARLVETLEQRHGVSLSEKERGAVADEIREAT
jgi:hypothetical protein